MKLLLLTNTFPFGYGETFVGLELPYLAKVFKEIRIVPLTLPAPAPLEPRPLPPNVSVDTTVAEALRRPSPPSIKASLLADARALKDLGRNLALRGGSPLRRTWLHWITGRKLARLLEALCVSGSYQAAYSYWFDTGALALAHVKRKRPALRCVARAHGYDLYAHVAGLARRPFQRETLRDLDAVFPCSNAGAIYLAQRHPSLRGRVQVHYLGVETQVAETRPSDDGVLRVLSCAHLVPVKRVSLVADALISQTRRVDWTHIGDGPLMPDLLQRVSRLPPNVRATLVGHWPRRKILEHYRKRPVDLFVNVSASEGLPLSIMESFAFGVPACATDVGGVREAVEEGISGFLLPPERAADRLAEIVATYETADARMRRGAREIQRQRFAAEQNFPAFASTLLRLTA